MFRRIYPTIVTWTGGIGLGLALTYFVGVGLAFVDGFERWADFFVPNAMWLLIPPYLLLIAHMICRNHVGRLLLNHGDYDAAIDYAGDRMESSIVRSRREAANQRLICAKGYIGRGDYDEAKQLLEGQKRRLPQPYSMEARRWLLELALRADDREAAEELVVDNGTKKRKARDELVAILGCEAELALRDGDVDRYRDRIKDAMWKDGSHPRLGLCRALAMVQYEAEDEESDEVLKLIDFVEEAIATDMPTRVGELKALRAKVTWRRGRRNEARRLLDEARQHPADAWTQTIIDEVEDLWADEPSNEESEPGQT